MGSPRPPPGSSTSGQSGALNESFSDYFGNVIGNLIHEERQRGDRRGRLRGLPAEPAVRGEPGRLLVVPLHAQRQRLRRLPEDPHAGRAVADPDQLPAGLRGRALQLGDLGTTRSGASARGWRRSTAQTATPRSSRTSSTGRSTAHSPPGSRRPAASWTRGQRSSRWSSTPSWTRWCSAPPRRSSTQVKICTGCPTVSELAGDAVSTASQTQLHPSISGNRVVWLDLSSTSDFAGYTAATSLGGSGSTFPVAVPRRARGRLRRRRDHVAGRPRQGHPHRRLGQHRHRHGAARTPPSPPASPDPTPARPGSPRQER